MILQPVLVPIRPTAAPRTPEQVAAQCAAARWALRLCAEFCGAPTDDWQKDNQDAPLPQGGFHWSIAHKRAWAAAVVADRPVGIDIEEITHKHDEAILDEVATAAEWGRLGDRSWVTFYRVWTAKEAILKANRVGIKGFSQCIVRDVFDDRHLQLEYEGQPWDVEQLYHDDHIAAVTSSRHRVEWRVITDEEVKPYDDTTS